MFVDRRTIRLRGARLKAPLLQPDLERVLAPPIEDLPHERRLDVHVGTVLHPLDHVRQIAIGGLPLGKRLAFDLAWMAGNAIVRHGMRGEIRLDKDKSGDKVDGIAALAMAVSRAIVQVEQRSVYEGRGVIAL
jgi:hypothetical protein